MANLKPIVTTILLLVFIAALCYWSYYEYKIAGQVTFIGALAAAGGIALLLSILKVWNNNPLISRAAGTSIDGLVDEKRKNHRADDSSVLRKRW